MSTFAFVLMVANTASELPLRSVAPVMATHGLVLGRRFRGLALFVAGFLAAAAIAMVPVFTEDSLSAFYHRTIFYRWIRAREHCASTGTRDRI